MQNQLFIKMTFDAFKFQLDRADKLFNSLTDEQLAQEVAPGRNSGTYLFGHLIAVHDAMLPLIGVGDKIHPELEEVFITKPDKSGLQKPPVSQLRDYWEQVNSMLVTKLESLTPEQWFGKHTAVSEEDFKKEPHRNKINILISRTNHLAYHAGQLAFLKK